MTRYENILKKLFLAGIFFTFLLLLYKNPFSERNLIPNLEPFPDTIHYLNPPLSFLEGKGFVIEREGRTIRPAVPFLYSASLIPGYFMNRDVRFFYFTNIILALSGLVLFYKFLGKVLSNSYIILFVLFLYATNYFIYWYPNIPMAENLILTLYLIGLYLLISKLTLKNAFLAGLVGISFYATKYASSSLTLTYLFLYCFKIFFSLIPEFRNFSLYSFIRNPNKFLNVKYIFSVLLVFVLGSSFSLLLFFFIDFLVRGNNIFFQLLEHVGSLVVSQTSQGSNSQSESWFAFRYFKEHLLTYLNALMGNQMRFLWDYTPLAPKYIAIPAIAGILISLFMSHKKFLSFALLFLISIPIIAISPFYSTDARYIYHAIPTLLIGFGLFLIIVYNLLIRYKLEKVFYVLLISFFVFYSVSNLQRLKYQIALNLKHSETPWYYMSVKNFNSYFASAKRAPADFQTKTNQSCDKPILITALQPFYIDFFSNSNYKLLPLSNGQEFFKRAEIVWGPNDYSDLIALYTKYLKEGRELYVTNAALGNEGYLHNGFNIVKENFIMDEVKKGCFDTCNIYRIFPKKNESGT